MAVKSRPTAPTDSFATGESRRRLRKADVGESENGCGPRKFPLELIPTCLWRA